MRSYTQIALQTAEKFWRDENGQTLVEYALLVNLVTLVLLLTLSIMGRRLQSTFSNVTNALKT